MIDLEQRGNEWAVVQNGELVSLHPTRAEAERAVLWLGRRHAPDRKAGHDAGRRETKSD